MTSADGAYLDLQDVAGLLRVGVPSVRTYHTRATAKRRSGRPITPRDLPAPDDTFGNSPVWKRERIEQWITDRTAHPATGPKPRTTR